MAERELQLRNTLSIHRPEEIVTVSLADLDISVEMEKKTADVEVTDRDGKPLPSQLDPFNQFAGFRAEIAFEVGLKPYEVHVVRVRFLDEKREDVESVCSVRVTEDAAKVTTPIYSIRAGLKGLLKLEQPKITPPKQTEDEELDDLMDEDDEEGGEEEADKMDLGAGEAPNVSAPLAGDGLPLAAQGLFFQAGRTTVKTWGGPVRAVIVRYHPGPWRVAKIAAPCTIRESFSFPRSGKRFFFHVRMHLNKEIPRARMLYGGLRVDSVSQPWQLIMGQRGKPPHVAPVNITLNNSKYIVLEPYQKSTFSHFWAQAVAKNAWVAVATDRTSSNIGHENEWGSGRQLIPSFIYMNDSGVYVNSVQPSIRFRKLPAGLDGRLRAAFHFGGEGDEPADGDTLSEIVNSRPAIPHRKIEPPKGLDVARLRALLAEKSVVVVAPDIDKPDRSKLWDRLSGNLGGMWRRSKGFLQYYNVMGGKGDASILTVLVGEPGTNPLLDLFNESHRVISAYPVTEDRTVVSLSEAEGEGPILFVAGSAEKATKLAVEQLLKVVGPVAERPAVALSPSIWADKMPQPWAGLRDHEGPLTALAYRNGYAEFLCTLRANRPITGLNVTPPEGAVCRYVPWKFEAEGDDNPRVSPVHDAAFPVPPAKLERDEILALWISLRVPRDAKAGTLRRTARLAYDGGERAIPLEAHVLSLPLADKPGFGFYPMTIAKPGLKFYYGWDDAEYYRHLPNALRQRGEFGPNAFSLDISEMSITADEDGNVEVDATEFKKELDAVRAAGCIDVMMTTSLNGLVTSKVVRAVAKGKPLDEYAAWEHVIPVMRRTLRELGLEDKIVCRHGDEIPDYEGWLPRAELFKRCGFRMSVAINGYGVFNKHLAVGTMGFWIPLYNFYLSRWGHPIADDDFIHFSKKFRDERHADGEEIWPYVCGPGPYAWSTRPRSQARYLILDTYMKGADGLSYYGGSAWSHAVDPAYRDTRKAKLFDTDSTFVTLFYPDYERNGILPSLRAGSFRIGLNDVNATEVLRSLAKEKGKLETVEAELLKSYATIEMGSPQEVFDAHRRKLDELFQGLAR